MSSPCKNFDNFLRNQPPLVVFVICLIAMSISMFIFAFCLQTDRVLNSDAQHDWQKLQRHFNGLDVCLEPNKNVEALKTEDFIPDYTVSTEVSLKFAKGYDESILNKISKVQGTLTLENWESICPKSRKKPDFFKITFYLQGSNNGSKFCAAISGPQEYLPPFSKPGCVLPKNTKFDGLLTSKLYTGRDNNFCKGVKGHIVFDIKTGSESFGVYLSEDDVNYIYLHLLWLSYIFIFIVLLILLYVIFSKNKKAEDTYRLG